MLKVPVTEGTRSRGVWALWIVAGFVGGWVILRVVRYATGFFLTPSIPLILALCVLGAVIAAAGLAAQRRLNMPGSVWIAALGVPVGWAAYHLFIARDEFWWAIIVSVTTLLLIGTVGLLVRWLGPRRSLTQGGESRPSV